MTGRIRGLSALLLGMLAASCAFGDEPTPRIEVSDTVFDIGEIWQGRPAQKSFSITNAGDAPLNVGVEASCGCTAVTQPKTPLAPGATTSFSITYDTLLQGKIDKRVVIVSSDPERGRIDVAVRGHIKPIFEGKPRYRILFLPMTIDDVRKQSIRLVNKYPEPVRLKLKPDQDFGRFAVELKELKAGQEYELTATTVPPLAEDFNHTEILLATDLEGTPILKSYATGRAHAAACVRPFNVVIDPETHGPIKQELSIQFFRDRNTKITGAKCSMERCSWERMPAAASSGPLKAVRNERIVLTLPSHKFIPPEGATFEIYTDHRDERYKTLTVTIVRSDAQ